VNDRRFIEAVEAGDPGLVLSRAEGEKSACSAGAVLGVMGFAAALREKARGDESAGAKAGPRPGTGGRPAAAAAGDLLAYSPSAAVTLKEEGTLPDSFVGYAAFGWR
jgi:hypothetical protein